MSIHLGVNAWVWQSPFTTAEHLGLIDKAAKIGFETFEIGLEDPSHVDPIKFKERLKANNMRVVVCGAFGPSRQDRFEHEEHGNSACNERTDIENCLQEEQINAS